MLNPRQDWLEKAKKVFSALTHAQKVLRLALEKNKKLKKVTSRTEKEARQEEKFRQKQEKKKQRGHSYFWGWL